MNYHRRIDCCICCICCTNAPFQNQTQPLVMHRVIDKLYCTKVICENTQLPVHCAQWEIYTMLNRQRRYHDAICCSVTVLERYRTCLHHQAIVEWTGNNNSNNTNKKKKNRKEWVVIAVWNCVWYLMLCHVADDSFGGSFGCRSFGRRSICHSCRRTFVHTHDDCSLYAMMRPPI